MCMVAEKSNRKRRSRTGKRKRPPSSSSSSSSSSKKDLALTMSELARGCADREEGRGSSSLQCFGQTCASGGGTEGGGNFASFFGCPERGFYLKGALRP